VADLLDLPAAARRLGVSVKTLRREHADGRIRLVAIRGVLRVRPAELDRYIAQQEEAACPSAEKATDGKSAFALEAARALSVAYHPERRERTRSTSKLLCAGAQSTPLRVVSRNG
jgi:excisionase family DNA binding protein